MHASVHASGATVSVDMGRVAFTHENSKFPSLKAEVININDKSFTYYRASVGNPHCVIPVMELSSELAKVYGKVIEEDKLFPNRTNVQFLKVLDRNTIQIEIWERGAGYTLASGSSSTASAAVAHALGLCEKEVSVKTPGGTIQIAISEGYHAVMSGPVCKIGEGSLASEALSEF